MNEYDGVWKMPTYAPWGFDKYADFNVSDLVFDCIANLNGFL
jgi:hypothetical protein